MPTRYPIRAVAKITGISPDTLRAWERRYGAVVPERFGRSRQYGPLQIARLNRLNQLVQKGHAIGSIAPLSDAELEALDAHPRSRIASAAETPPTDLLRPVLSAIEEFDAALLSDELVRLAAILAPRDFVYHAVAPLMREVEARWHDGRFAIAQGQLLSQALRNLLGGMSRLFHPTTPARKMLIAAPGSEPHEFGILAAAMLAAMAGVETVYLGTDLPAGETARVSRLVSAQVVLLGLTTITERAMAEVRAMVADLPDTTELWLCGAEAPHIDLAQLERPAVVLADLPAFEERCRSWRSK